VFCVLFINDEDGDPDGRLKKSVLGVLSGREEKPSITSCFTLCFLDLNRKQEETLIDGFRQPGVVVTRKEGLNGDCSYNIHPEIRVTSGPVSFSIAEMAHFTGFNRYTILRVVQDLLKREILVPAGSARRRRYSLTTKEFADVTLDTAARQLLIHLVQYQH
jgi:hypothetical protein